MIKEIRIMNVMGFFCPQRECFAKEDSTSECNFDGAFSMKFVPGVNVLIGESGTGKTALMKMIYCAAQNSGVGKNCSLTDLFLLAESNPGILINTRCSRGYYRVSDGEYSFSEFFIRPAIDEFPSKPQTQTGWTNKYTPAIFIPSTEILSHAKSLLELSKYLQVPFDRTYADILANASLPKARTISFELMNVSERIGRVIGGVVIHEDDTFYVCKDNGARAEFALEADGLRQLGLIWKLIWNGLLTPGSILLWDAPETNMSPTMFPLIADVLLMLQRSGVQIFLATHSYSLALYLELRRREKEDVLFHNLRKEGDCICTQSAHRMDALADNHIINAENRLLDDVYDGI